MSPFVVSKSEGLTSNGDNGETGASACIKSQPEPSRLAQVQQVTGASSEKTYLERDRMSSLHVVEMGKLTALQCRMFKAFDALKLSK